MTKLLGIQVPDDTIYIAGVDEAGRGPLAGAVVAAAVILNPARAIEGLTDSKKLSEKRRETLFEEIKEHSLAWSIGRADVEEIDRLNILQASLLAMKRAVDALSPAAEFALVDGNKCPDLRCPVTAIVKGDELVECISAASVIAKVTRDNEMKELDRKYPDYGFAKHKGYPTRDHIKNMERLGVTEIHRRSYSPVKKILEKTN